MKTFFNSLIALSFCGLLSACEIEHKKVDTSLGKYETVDFKKPKID
tara:strand:- start:19 stop:156 length:138 start_codon:yes stop_codon:yes gene_type:complete